MNCTRCKKKVGKKCEICPDYLCNKCSKIHTKYQECFIEKQSKPCYFCLREGDNNEGQYDYGIKRFICVYHI